MLFEMGERQSVYRPVLPDDALVLSYTGGFNWLHFFLPLKYSFESSIDGRKTNHLCGSDDEHAL